MPHLKQEGSPEGKGGGSLKYVTEGSYLSNAIATDEVGWFPIEVPFTKMEPAFVQLIQAQITNNPFSGIYRYIYNPHSHHIYLYMRNSERVKDLLNSAAMGAGFKKKEVGTILAGRSHPLNQDDIDLMGRLSTTEISYASSQNILKCFRGKGSSVNVRHAIQQIKQENIKLIEFSSSAIQDLSVNGEITGEVKGEANQLNVSDEALKSLIWSFRINAGYVFGLVSDEIIQTKGNALTLNDIEPIIVPITGWGIQDFPSVPGMFNLSKLKDYLKIVEEGVNTFVAGLQPGDYKIIKKPSDIQKPPETQIPKDQRNIPYGKGKSTNKYTEDILGSIQNITELLKFAEEEKEEQEKQEKQLNIENTIIDEPSIQEEDVPAKEDVPTEESLPIKVMYKVDSFKIRIKNKNLLAVDVIVDINEKKFSKTIDLDGAQLSDLITPVGFELILEEADLFIEQYGDRATCKGNSLGSISSTVDKPNVPGTSTQSITAKNTSIDIYEIDTNALTALNVGKP